MKYLVPLARANKQDCVRMVAGITEPISSRQVAQLYAGYKATNKAGRARLCDAPLLYLRAQEAARQAASGADDEAVDEPPDRLFVRDLGAIAGIARRLTRHLGHHVAVCLGDTQRAEVESAMGQARHDTQTMFTRCEQELRHVGPSDTNGDSKAAC